MSARKYIKFWDVFTSYPPYYVRILAKKPGSGNNVALSDAEIAIAAGIPINRIREIARMATWDTLTYREILAFTSACNFDPTNSLDRNREQQYHRICLRRGSRPFKYLRSHPKWHSEFLPLVKMMTARFAAAQNPAIPVHV